jgi:hypothetical protein
MIDVVRDLLRRTAWWTQGLNEELKMHARQAAAKGPTLSHTQLENLAAALVEVGAVLQEEHARVISALNPKAR